MTTAATTDQSPAPDAPTEENGRMTFTAHLGELRTRMIRSVIAIVVGFLFCYIFSNEIIEILSYPLSPLQSGSPDQDLPAGADTQETEAVTWIVLTPLEPILVSLKISAFGGVFLAIPFILYQICSFVFPGLTLRERRAVKLLLVGCSVLAIAGAAIAYWGVFPQILPYLMTKFLPEGVSPQLRLNETLSIILKGIGGFALAFQFPMIVLALVYVGILTPESLKAYRKIAIVGVFIAGALLTPPDPISLVLIAIPLVLLYEMSIWLSHFVVRRKDDADSAG